MISAIFIGILILALPFILGPLRNGIKHFLFSLILMVAYIAIIFYSPGFLSGLFGMYFRFDIIIGLIISIPILSSIIFYFTEKGDIESESENFYDERLFYKYGYLIQKNVIPLGIGETKEGDNLIDELYEFLKEKLENKFKSDPLFRNQDISVNDSKHKDDSRYFLKLAFTTIRKSTYYNFINLKQIGEQIAVNNLQYVKSSHKWYHVLLFIMTAPFHYWSWIYHRVGSKYSIDSYLGGYYYGNSFDIIDLEVYVKASTFIVLRSIEDFAEEKGLLTEELRQLIVNNINNTQNIHIEKSKGVRIGKLKLSSKAA